MLTQAKLKQLSRRLREIEQEMINRGYSDTWIEANAFDELREEFPEAEGYYKEIRDFEE